MRGKRSSSSRTERALQLLVKISEWHKGFALVSFILILALATRLIDLSSFPYFPSSWPWNGINGVYQDEIYISQAPFLPSAYWPFLQLSLTRLAISILGNTPFAIRLASALFSSVTCILVYLSSYELFHRTLPALLSSLYFIFMTPALIYGRMAFLENGATTFFVATFLFTMKYMHTSKDRWLVCSGICAGLSFLCKQTGLAATIFLILFVYLYKPEARLQLLKVLLIPSVLISTYLLEILIVDPNYLNLEPGKYVYAGIGIVAWLSVLICNLLPSGTNLMWIDNSLLPFKDLFRFATLDFWYVLAFFIILYLMVREKGATRGVVLAVLSFILLMMVIGHTNAYYVILVQPFMAIPLGYGLIKLQNMSGVFAFAFAFLLCFPAITCISYYITYILLGSTVQGIWIALYLLLISPVVVLGVLRLLKEGMKQEKAILINRYLLVFYLACLMVGSYVLPVFYPGYFAQSSVPV